MRNFGLIGYPLEHSFSKLYFEKKFKNQKIKDVSYENYEIENISSIQKLINDKELNGLNITIPYKEKVLSFIDELDESAAKIGSVNVIKFQDKKLKGFNTDYLGFKKSLVNWIPNSEFSAVILGSGGSSKAVIYVLNELKIPFNIISRSKSSDMITYDELKKSTILSESKLIINTTPLGMYPNIKSCPDIDFKKLSKNHYIFDLVYNPSETKLLNISKKKGAKIKNGYEMLVNQAEYSWEIWNK